MRGGSASQNGAMITNKWAVGTLPNKLTKCQFVRGGSASQNGAMITNKWAVGAVGSASH